MTGRETSKIRYLESCQVRINKALKMLMVVDDRENYCSKRELKIAERLYNSVTNQVDSDERRETLQSKQYLILRKFLSEKSSHPASYKEL